MSGIRNLADNVSSISSNAQGQSEESKCAKIQK